MIMRFGVTLDSRLFYSAANKHTLDRFSAHHSFSVTFSPGSRLFLFRCHPMIISKK
jgi:hypothetical protein